INVPCVPLPSGITILVGLVYQANGYTAIDGVDGDIGIPLIGNPIHDDVDLLVFLIKVRLGAIKEILAVVDTGRKVQFRINWKGRIVASKWSIDIPEVGIVDLVGPKLIIFCLKALNQ